MPFDEEELDPHGECQHEINRLRSMLVAIATQNYDVGYSAEKLAEHALDPRFDVGDLGCDEAFLAKETMRLTKALSTDSQ